MSRLIKKPRAIAQTAHDAVKWVLSLFSATATLGFVYVLETA